MTETKPQRSAPWAVRGVSPEARDAAGMACKRRGIPLGQWLDRVVLDAAMAELKGSARQEVGPTQADMMARMMETMEAMKSSAEATNKRLDEIAAKVEQPPAPVEPVVQPQTGGRLFGWLRGPRS